MQFKMKKKMTVFFKLQTSGSPAQAWINACDARIPFYIEWVYQLDRKYVWFKYNEAQYNRYLYAAFLKIK